MNTINELSKETLNSYRDSAVDHKERLKGNIARTKDHIQQSKEIVKHNPTGSVGDAHREHIKSNKSELSSAQRLLKNRRAGIDRAGEKLNNEETAEQAADHNKRLKKFKDMAKQSELEPKNIKEANHREFAAAHKMHPDMAKHMSVGQEHDYYEPGTGDKVSGKVMHKSATEVHMKQTHDSYDPKKKGTVHKFKIAHNLNEGEDKEMVMIDLQTIINHVNRLEKHIDKEMDLPEWVEAKITLAADYIGTVADYIEADLQVNEELEDLEEGYDKNSINHKKARNLAKVNGGKATFHPNGHAHVTFNNHVVGRSALEPKGTTLWTGSEMAASSARDHGGKAEGNKVHFKEETKKKPKWLEDAEKRAEAREGKLKESEMKSFKDFVGVLKEYESDKNGVYRHTKKASYGTSYNDPEGEFESKDDMKKPAKKSGRQAGSSVGSYKRRQPKNDK